MGKAPAKAGKTLARSARTKAVRKTAGSTVPVSSAAKRPASVLKVQMPEWKIVPNAPLVETIGVDNMRTDEGPSLKHLRMKFFGQTDKAAGAMLAEVDKSVKTVRIQPKSGGATKTADIRNGKVTIVQG